MRIHSLLVGIALTISGVFSQTYSGNFHVGGSTSWFYPVLFSVSGVDGTSSLGKLSIYIDNVHANGPGSGSFHSDIEFISSNYGHMPSKVVKVTYITGYGNTYSDPIGDIVDGSTKGGDSQLVVWLKGGATYQWSAPSDSRVILSDPNSEGRDKISASGYTLNSTNTQSALILKAKSNTYQNTGIVTDGNVGIGADPSEKLDVRGNLYINSGIDDNHIYWGSHNMTMGTKPGDYSHNVFTLKPGGASNGKLVSVFNMWNANSPTDFEHKIQIHTDGISYFNGGKVGIGISNPDVTLSATPAEELLSVNGTIHAKEVKVSLDGLADYVFHPTYKLMPLPEVEQYVKTNSHLPEIPSATEVSKNGMSMGEMQNKLLQKVEELTLYVIEQQKRIEQLEKNANK
jgi:hypothetical protein